MATRGVERAVDAAREPGSSLERIGRQLRDVGADRDTLARVDRTGETAGRFGSATERTKRLSDSGGDVLRAWQQRRDRGGRKPPALRDLDSYRSSSERMLGMSAGSVDDLTALRDRERLLWPEKKEAREKDEPKDREKKPRSPSDRLKDLDKRREQALERLKAKRRGEQSDERRRGLSRDRLAAMGDRFGGLGA